MNCPVNHLFKIKQKISAIYVIEEGTGNLGIYFLISDSQSTPLRKAMLPAALLPDIGTY